MKKLYIVIVAFLLHMASPQRASGANEFWLGQQFSVTVEFEVLRSAKNGVQRPAKITLPEYPCVYVEAWAGGIVTVEFDVLGDGSTANVTYIGGDDDLLLDATKQAVERMRFTPSGEDTARLAASSKMRCTTTFKVVERPIPRRS